MRALAVLDHHEIPVELGVALQRPQGLQLFGGGRNLSTRLLGGLDGGDLVGVALGDLLDHLLDLLADRRHALLFLGLDVLDLRREIVVALAAVAFNELLVLKRARPVVRGVLAILALDGAHVAVGAAVALLGHGSHVAAVHRLELGVLHLDHRSERVGMLPILVAALVVVRQDGVGRHLVGALVRVGGDLRVGIEVVLVVALAAHLGLHGNLARLAVVAPERLDEVLPGHAQRLGLVLVAVVAADRLGELADHVVELLGVHPVALAIDLRGELGRLAGDAVRQLLFLRGARRLLHALERVDVAGRLVVAQRERVALVHRVQGRVQLQVVVFAGVGRIRLVLHVGAVLVGVDVLPRLGGDHAVLVRLGRPLLLGKLGVARCGSAVARVGRGLRRAGSEARNQAERAQRGTPERNLVPLDFRHELSSFRLAVTPP